MVSFVGWHEIFMEWDCVRHEFYDAGYGSERQDLVRSDTEVSLTRDAIRSEKLADLFKNLFHY